MSGGFLYLGTTAEPIYRRLGYTVRGGIEAGGQMKCPRTAGLGYTYIYIYKIIFWFQGFGQDFILARPKYAIRGTGILGQIASFERRLREAAPTPLALPCPFRTST